MTKTQNALDPSFVEGKRRELLALREALKKVAGTSETEEA
jgi:hypothetical protein